MDTPVVQIDTRQQANKHNNIDNWFATHKVQFLYKKLDFGDYMTSSSNISIDTKQNLAEVASNLGRDHARFAREIKRANEAGYKLVVLIEVGHPYHSIDDVPQWTSTVCQRCEKKRFGYCDPKVSIRCMAHKTKPMQGSTLARIMRTIEHKYGCQFMFCNKRSTGRVICELLGIDYAK